ncbi:MAG TPA: outer membrane protein assembly factor BamA, partial [Bdellovibrionota bacterium]|nr:outer membrane protein assembly factor BamA [Bdellovibrionota bacterium]
SIYITIVVKEGEPYTVGKVLLDGEFIKEKTELEKVISLKGQKLVDTSLIQKDVGELTTIYADEGYAYANVNILDRYDDEKKIVDITYVLQPGQKVWVEKIKFVGNTSTRDKILRREMQINEGGQYHQTKIRDSRLNIERLSLFEEVRLSTPRGSADDRVDIVVDLKEKPTGTFSIGAGFNTLESFQIIAQVQKRNLFGRGYDVSLDARLGGKTQAFNVRFRDEYFLDSKWGFEVNGFNISRVYTDFDLTSRGGTVGLDYPLYKKGLERIRFGVTYSLIDEDLTDIRTTVEQLFTSGLTSSVTTSLTRDTRNRVFEPTKGSYYRLSEEVAGGGLGGDNDFWKSEFDARWFFPLLDQKPVPLIGDSVFALRLNLGYVGVLSDGERVPLFERYFPGGILSIRGFQLRSLGPTIDVASSTDPGSFTTTEFHVGGNKELIFNAEYIFPIVRAANIKGVFFFDMGNAFDNGESIFTITGQRQSTGFGVRWFSPIGPLRFEWGFPLDRKEDESLVVFDFTIGSIF